MKTNNSCPYCYKGKIKHLINYADFHFNGECPVIEEYDCEECGGTGEWSGRECPRCGSELLVNEYGEEWCSHVECNYKSIGRYTY